MKQVITAVSFSLTCLAFAASAQQNQQPAASGGAVVQQQPYAPAAPNGQQVPPRVNPQGQYPPGAQGQAVQDPNASVNPPPQNGTTAGGLFSTNTLNTLRTNLSSLGTNAYQHLSNGWSSVSNWFKGTNQSEPTSNRGTNRAYGTNSYWMTNGTSMQMRDEAYTPQDQTLLVQLRQEVRPLFANRNRNQAWMPVHFICRERRVTVIGFVPDEDDKRKIVALVKETPGVVDVDDQLQISSGEYGFQPGTPSAPSAASAATQPNIGQDEAYSSSDRTIVVKVRQEVQPIIGNSEPWMPVHFMCRDGILTLVGFVPNEQERQQIFEACQRTPGVVQVVNQLQVNTAASSANMQGTNTQGALGGGYQPSASNGFAYGSTNQLQATNAMSGSLSGMTNAYGAATNLTPTGR